MKSFQIRLTHIIPGFILMKLMRDPLFFISYSSKISVAVVKINFKGFILQANDKDIAPHDHHVLFNKLCLPQKTQACK